MMYPLRKALGKALYYWKSYLPIALELAVGLGFLLAALNYNLSADAALRALRSEVSQSELAVGGSPEDINDPNALAALGTLVTYEDFLAVRALCAEAAEALFCSADLLFLGVDDGGGRVLYVSDSIFEKLGLSAPAQGGYVGAGFHAAAGTAPTVSTGRSSYSAGDRTLTPPGGEPVALSPLPEEYETRVLRLSENWQYTLGGCALVPFSALSDPAGAVSPYTTQIYLRFSDMTQMERLGAQVEALLADRHPGASYSVSNELAQFTRSYNYYTSTVNTFAALAGFATLIVVFGVSGVLLIYVNRRRRELAVSMACGATFRTAASEFILELASVVSFGGALAYAGGAGATLLLSSPMFSVQIYPVRTLLMAAGVCLAIVAAASLVSLPGLRRARPAEILRGN